MRACRRHQAIAARAAVAGLGIIIGPALVGWLLEHFALQPVSLTLTWPITGHLEPTS
jgi:MFS family permease